MSEHDEFMPLCADIEKVNHCITCGVELNKMRDGRTDSNHCCRNCYWREQNIKARQEKDIVKMNCYSCENTFNWETGTDNFCNDCPK